MNINNKAGATGVGGSDLENGQAMNPAPSSVSNQAAAAILQNNSLRKSMQGSTAGLRSL